MAALRPHLAINVSDVQRSILFYAALFDAEPEKVRPGYAKFGVADPPLNFTLNESRQTALGAFNHGGIEVADPEAVLAAKERLVEAGLATFDEMDTTCCYARQDKIWGRDPDGTPWEVFTRREDSEEAGDGGPAAVEGKSCACGETGCGCASHGTADLCCA
jgi:catechol 2,3-dioxygenase-like lactoylglutathione lyase family enzyme